MSTFELGTRYDIGPLPYDAAATTFFPAGDVTIAVEYRQVDEEALKAGFGEELVAAEQPNFDDAGVSLHLLGTDDGLEYIRLDCFDHDAHYHYISPGSHQIIVPFDRTVNGDMLQWALRILEDRIPAILEFVGASELAASIDADAVHAALVDVRTVAEEAQRQHRAAFA